MLKCNCKKYPIYFLHVADAFIRTCGISSIVIICQQQRVKLQYSFFSLFTEYFQFQGKDRAAVCFVYKSHFP